MGVCWWPGTRTNPAVIILSDDKPQKGKSASTSDTNIDKNHTNLETPWHCQHEISQGTSLKIVQKKCTKAFYWRHLSTSILMTMNGPSLSLFVPLIFNPLIGFVRLRRNAWCDLYIPPPHLQDLRHPPIEPNAHCPTLTILSVMWRISRSKHLQLKASQTGGKNRTTCVEGEYRESGRLAPFPLGSNMSF